MEQTEQSLFGSKLNETGKNYIRKFAKITRILILVGILLSIVVVTQSIIRLFKRDLSVYSDWLVQFYYRISPIYSFVYTVLFFLQLFYYWKVSKALAKGADYNDEIEFNNAFMTLYRNAVLALITLSVAFLMNLLYFFVAVKYYLK